ncbi:putative hydrolase, alpha/beta fold protein [Mycobacterium saskatchewanense]|uniref:Serine aminopeptidase S33 domain-containing protein n=1 Tax=Mycobacterium saskatchewanense TaxID=220927 RepID=A0AAJ3NMC2_9MYCO|nr:alpha/beta fold hydrolase [Mycobacterium saskatchewanense]ORW68044.1 hypothetical protein AWC23_21645 [Mycobacterium saskatchewanense]BBX66515.1 putative hydrolase, alpha/beta fold protein [Mycobacterium saskatchewanense]
MTRVDVSRLWCRLEGDKIAVFRYEPLAPTRGPTPIVVMGHGFAGTHDAGLNRFASALADAGIGVLAFDYRGFGESGGAPRQVVSPAWQRADYQAVVAMAGSLPGTRPVVLWGYSLSGAHVIRLSACTSGIAATIAMAPFIDAVRAMPAYLRFWGARGTAGLALAAVRDVAASVRDRSPVLVPAVGPSGTAAMLASPDAEAGYRHLAAEASSWRNEVAARFLFAAVTVRVRHHARRVSTPLLVQVADRDLNAPPHLAIQAAQRGELRRHADAAHFDVAGPAFEALIAEQVDFIRRYLGP